jgi:transposase-like protein
VDRRGLAPCPTCKKTEARAVRYTVWGGLLGPLFFKQVRCQHCGTDYNGKTGATLKRGISIYIAVATLLALAALVALFLGV